MSDMTCDDLTLLQMHLLKFIDLINRSGEQRLLHQQQMIIGLDSHEVVDDIFQVRGIRARRPNGHPIPFSPLLIRRKTGQHTRVFVENTAPVQNPTGQQRAQPVRCGRHLLRQHNVQATDFRSQGRRRKSIGRERQRTEGDASDSRRREMPQLVIIILGMGLPDDEQAVTALRVLDAIPESLPQHDGLGSNLEGLQERLEFRTALRTLSRRVCHPEGFVMHMCGSAQPIDQWNLRLFVQFSQQHIGGWTRDWRLTHIHSFLL